MSSPAVPSTEGKTWFGHPRGLMTLFFTELWERFSYYGMRGILVLYLTDRLRGGFGMDALTAGAIYGLYTSMVYLVALPGGWIADNIMGQRNAIFAGGVIIACGHFSMAVPTQYTFYLGLCLIIVGTGLLKPNVSAIVGGLYPEGGARRDAGFSIFYMGINVGALCGPLICGSLGENINWHYGFGAAGVGMVFGLIQYRLGYKYFHTVGVLPEEDKGEKRSSATRRLAMGVGALVAIAVIVAIVRTTLFQFTIQQFARFLGAFVIVLAICYFGGVVLFGKLTSPEKKRVIVIFLLFVGAALFWSGFEQAGSSMNLFAERLTDRFWGDPTLDSPALVESLGIAGAVYVDTSVEVEDGWSSIKASPGAGPGELNRAVEALSSLTLVSGNEGAEGRPHEAESEPFLEIERSGTQDVRMRVAAGVVPADSLIMPDGTRYPVEDYADYGWVMPASWLQSVNPLFIICLAPVFGWIWVALSARKREPSLPVKFFYGLFLLGVAFMVLAWGALYTDDSWPGVSPLWLIVTYFLQTTGELCLSPVGLSSITKLSPKRLVGQMMGTWFMGAALGNLIAGLIGGQFETLPLPTLFTAVAAVSGGAGFLFLIFSGPIRKLIGGEV